MKEAVELSSLPGVTVKLKAQNNTTDYITCVKYLNSEINLSLQKMNEINLKFMYKLKSKTPDFLREQRLNRFLRDD